MNEIRRTLLWVVFTLSLLLLWDSWQRHNGQPSLLGVPTPSASVAGTKDVSVSQAVPAASTP